MLYMSTLRALIVALSALSLVPHRADALPGPVGGEFAVEDREIPPWGWWTTCTDGNGMRSSLAPECDDADCSLTGHLILERTGIAGEALATRLRVTETPAVLTYYRVTCHPDGAVLLQWRDAAEGCYVHRLVEADGAMPNAPKRTAPKPYDCRARPAVALRGDGSFLAVWGAAHLDGGSGVMVQSIDSSGEMVGASAKITDDAIGWNRYPKVAIGADGGALVTWLGDASGIGVEPVLARYLGRDAAPIGDVMRLDTFGYGRNAPPVVEADASGDFTVIWSNPLQGGRVARNVAMNAPPVEWYAGRGSATLPGPRFGALRVVDSFLSVREDLDVHALDLAKNPRSPWVVRRSSGSHQLSFDVGVRWTAPSTSGLEGFDRAMAISESAGIVLIEGQRDQSLYVARTAERGAAWREPIRIGPIVLDARRCPACTLQHSAIAASADGSAWIVAWTAASPAAAPLAGSAVYAVASLDGGKRWGKVQTVASGSGAGAGGFDLAFGGDGTAMIAWSDEDVWVARARNPGSAFDPAVAVASGVSCAGCAWPKRYGRVQVVADPAAWGLVFSAARYRPDRYGFDGDVFASRSVDGGRSWSLPVALVADAATDGWRDFGASVAADGSGHWIATWSSHRPVDGDDEMDPDVMIALSNDAGATWSVPTPARGTDVLAKTLEWNPVVATGDDDTWMLVWQRRDYDQPDVEAVDQILAAVGNAECGNGEVEAGEECDDGNGRDGDRCDTNCTRPRCGNGIVDRSEECDDGNQHDDDSCLSDCTPARCGDGVTQPPGEACDDGNDVDDDECPTSCRWSRCGDGFVDPLLEECDDGNTSSSDECTEVCRHARCGDGYVRDFVEACDDGNDVGTDECPNTCDRAVCGDGHTSKGFEECDPMDPLYQEICSDDCETIDLCGDADADGAVTVVDVQRILGRAIRLPVRCPREVCDMDGSGAVRARDARIGVSAAVGLDVGARCSIGTGNLVFWIASTVEIGALQFEIDYSATGGEFVGAAGAVKCETLAPNVDDDGEVDPDSMGFASFNDIEEIGQLNVAMVSIPGFSGPMDLFRCAFVLPEEREGIRLAIRPVDASDVDLAPIVPFPMLGYRLE
jgi:cysteine-rich repeat protein